MNFYVRVRCINKGASSFGSVGYVFGHHPHYACYLGNDAKGSVYTKEEAEMALACLAKFWELVEFEPTEKLTLEEFMATIPREPEEPTYQI